MKYMENSLRREPASVEMSNVLINLNKYIISSKKHIKEYYKLRKLHSEILDNMEDYIMSGKYNINKELQVAKENIDKEAGNIRVNLNHNNDNDMAVFTELFIYKNYPTLVSVTEVYLQKHKFRKEEKIKMLNSMMNSYASLFKIIDIDIKNGYVIYEDVFTKQKFKIIDIAMSSTLKIDSKNPTYIYNRIITCGDISFGTGLPCIMTYKFKPLQKFIEKYKNKNISGFVKCLMLYDLSKKDNSVMINCNSNY